MNSSVHLVVIFITPGLDSSIPSTFNSILHDTSEGHYWSALQLKTCDIQHLAVNHWLSDLIVYRIAELLNESNPDIYVFYYNFNSDIKDGIKRIRKKHPKVQPDKIIFAINVGKWNGKTYLGNTMVGRKIISGCHFAMGVYYTQQNDLFYCDSKGWQMPQSVIRDCKQLISEILNS